MTVVETITQCLRDAGAVFQFDEANERWIVVFDLDGHYRETELFVIDGHDYVYAVAWIDPLALAGGIRALPATVLATLIERQSSETLAKIDYVSRHQAFCASSACSIDGPTGIKLLRRMEACARLALAVEQALAALPRE